MPALLGLPALLTAGLTWLVRTYFAWALVLFTYRTAKLVALLSLAITVMGALTIGMAMAIKGMILALVVAVPSWAQTGAYFLPTNLHTVLSAIIMAKSARFVYDWTMANFAWALKTGYETLRM